MAKNHRQVQSVSVTPELKARMDKVKQKVNWSAIACRAFEAKLSELANRHGLTAHAVDRPTDLPGSIACVVTWSGVMRTTQPEN